MNRALLVGIFAVLLLTGGNWTTHHTESCYVAPNAVWADDDHDEHRERHGRSEHGEGHEGKKDGRLDLLDIFGWGGVIVAGVTTTLTLSKRFGIKIAGQLKAHQTIGWLVPAFAIIHGVTAWQHHPELEAHQIIGITAATFFALAALFGWRMGKGRGRDAYMQSRFLHVSAVVIAVCFAAFHVLGGE